MTQESITIEQLLASIHPEIKALIADMAVVQRVQQREIEELRRKLEAAVEAVAQKEGAQ
jgi:hypothetical protein